MVFPRGTLTIERTVQAAVTFCILSDRPQHLRVLLACLQVQTCPDWAAIVLDQSENGDGVFDVIAKADERMTWEPVPRRGDWGQTEKFAAAERATTEFVAFPNDDAYYCQQFVELMLAASVGQDLVYCDWVSAKDMGIPYVAYRVEPIVGRIDVGGFIVRRTLLVAHGWPDKGPTGDGLLIESLVAKGARHVRVPAILMVKN